MDTRRYPKQPRTHKSKPVKRVAPGRGLAYIPRMDWKRFFDSLGLNGSQWQWRILRWQRRWQDWLGTFRGTKQTVTYRHKFCPDCGALLDRNEKSCPQCETKAPSWRRQSMGRALGLVTPTSAVATPALLVANIGIMLALMLRHGGAFLFHPTTGAMVTAGALVPGMVREGALWQLVTYGYLHFGLLHIVFNLFALSQVGPMLEKELGSARFFVVYTLSLIGAGLADTVLRAYQPTVVAGASGALFGLIGFGVAYCHFARGHLREMYRGFFLTWAAYGFIFGLAVPNIDNVAHGGGFAVGAVLGWLIEREQRQPLRASWWQTAALTALAVTVGAFVWMLWAARAG